MNGSLRRDRFSSLHIRSWWVLVFTTLSLAFYFQAAHSRTTAISDLSSRMKEMENAKLLTSEQNEALAIRLQSESDPAWIEMTLMKELGVVPEGWVKVHFQK